MLKRPITYTNFNDEEVTEVYYFYISESELVELEVSYKQGFAEALTAIVEAGDRQRIIAEFKKIILLAYGVKSEDGKRFVKTDELRQEFTQTAAYNALFMELSMDDGKAAEFINAVVPKNLDRFQDQDKPQSPPQIPSQPPTQMAPPSL